MAELVTDKNRDGVIELFLGLNTQDVQFILPLLLKKRDKVKIAFEKYLDIHECGEATERQETMRQKKDEELRLLNGIILKAIGFVEIKEICKPKPRFNP